MSLLNEQNRKWWTLGTVTFSLFMVMLDTTIVNVALPAIQADLSLEISDLEWIVNGFLLTYAVFLLTGGKLADFLGRRRIFLTGFFVFVASSLACGLAVNGSMLIAARAAQGVGAALMLPGTLSIISATFSVRERGTAFGIWAGVSGLGLALGPLVGGLLTEGIGWRWIFFVNVPLGAIGLVAGRLIIRESRDTSEEQRLDVAGLVASGAALFLLTFALVEGNGYGWGSPVILMCFAGSAAAFAAFLLLEHRQRLPMLDLALFRNPTFAGASLVALTLTLALLGVLFFVSIYLQTILGYSAVRAGLAFMPMTLLFMALAPPTGKIADRIGPRWPIATGMTLLAVALFLMSRLGADSSFWEQLPALLLAGAGLGMTLPPVNAAALGSVPVAKAGVAAGVLNTCRQTGGSLGVAIMGAILLVRIGDRTASDPGFAEAFMAGFENALRVAAIIVLAGAVTAALAIRRLRERGASQAFEAGL